jgi:hypothetical protein
MPPTLRLVSYAALLSHTLISAVLKASFEFEDGRFRRCKIKVDLCNFRILLLQHEIFA